MMYDALFSSYYFMAFEIYCNFLIIYIIIINMKNIFYSTKLQYSHLVSSFFHSNLCWLISIVMILMGVFSFVFAQDILTYYANQRIDKVLNEIEKKFDETSHHWLYNTDIDSTENVWAYYVAREKKTEWNPALLLYKDSTCVYWNAPMLSKTPYILSLEQGVKFHSYNNDIFISKVVKHGDKRAVMFFIVSHDYDKPQCHTYEYEDEQFLVDVKDYSISLEPHKSDEIIDASGNSLLSIKYKVYSDSLYFFKFIFVLGILILLFKIGDLILKRCGYRLLPILIIVTALVIVFLSISMRYIQFFPVEAGGAGMKHNINMRILEYFGYENTIGLMFIDSVAIFLFAAFNLSVKSYFEEWLKNNYKSSIYFVVIVIYSIITSSMICYLGYTFLVILNVIAIDINYLSFNGLGWFDLLSYTIPAISITSFFLINKLETNVFSKGRWIVIVINIIVGLIFILMFQNLFSGGMFYFIISCFIIIALEILYLKHEKRETLYLLITIVLSILMTFLVIKHSQKSKEERLIYIANTILKDSIDFDTVYGFMVLTSEEREIAMSDVAYTKLQNNKIVGYKGGLICMTKLKQIRTNEFVMDVDRIYYRVTDGYTDIIVSSPNKLGLLPLSLFIFVFIFMQACMFLLLGIKFFFPDIQLLKESIHVKLKVVIIAIYAVVTLFVYAFVNDFLNKSQVEDSNAGLLSKIRSVNIYLKSIGIADIELEELNEYIKIIQESYQLNLTVFNEKGEFVMTSDPVALKQGIIPNFINPDYYKELQVNNKSFFSEKKPVYDVYYNVGVFVANISDRVFLFQVNNIRMLDLNLKNSMNIDLINTFIIALFILYIVLSMFYYHTMKPLIKLQNSLLRIDLHKRIDSTMYKRGSEVDGLVDLYNNAITKLEDTLVKLANSERTDVMKTLTRQIAHELKNPITPIKLNAQMILMRKKNGDVNWDKNIEEKLNAIVGQIDIFSNTINQLYSETYMTIVDSINIDKKMNEVKELYGGYYNIKVRYVNETKNKNLSIRMSLDNLWSVLTNIMVNAVAAIDDKKDGRIDMALNIKDNMVVISIKDNGIGISNETKGYVFMPNFTTKEMGSGLGLVLASGFVKNAGGIIYFESEINIGTVFYIEIPYVDRTKKNDI